MTDWTNTSKPWGDRDRPFHRVNSQSYDEKREPPSGHGYDCGCRSKDDYVSPPDQEEGGESLRTYASRRIMVTVPPWVPVAREGPPDSMGRTQPLPVSQWPTLPEKEKEVEGYLSLSHQADDDVPVAQIHLWYDWCFLVEPIKGYDYLGGQGNPAKPGYPGRTVECEWDLGAFGDYAFPFSVPDDGVGAPLGKALPYLGEPGPMFSPALGRFDNDWCWPGSTQHVWVAGRWIYDCGHASEPTDAAAAANKHTHLMRTELHPCKAVATARWEAIKFDENEKEVPAIQFMFFACRKGGYKNFPSIISDSGTDYEFIVDLPEAPGLAREYPIGHTPDFALNTLVLPRLLKKFDYSAFQNAFPPLANPGEADPEIELLPPEHPGEASKQVKIRIPLTKLGGGAPNSYGVIVSLGWRDPHGEQAATVKKVTLVFSEVMVGGARSDDEFGPWQINLGVNGRWFATLDTEVSRQKLSIPFRHRLTLFLSERDEILISAHGLIDRPVGVTAYTVGTFLGRKLHERMGRRADDGVAYEYDRDFDHRNHAYASRVADDLRRLLTVTLDRRAIKLGRITPGIEAFPGETPNPMTVRDLIKRARRPKVPIPGKLSAVSPKEGVGKGTPDYTLVYTIEYDDV